MVEECWINNNDAYKTWGIFLSSESFTTLITSPPLKGYIENKSALMDGKQVLNDENNAPKVDERDMQIVFGIKAKNLDNFLQLYADFTEVLKKGKLDIRTKYQPGVTYHCNYISCSQLTQFNGRLGKFILKVNEPNPNNRD